MADEMQSNSTLVSIATMAACLTVIALFAVAAVAPATANHGSDSSNYTIVLPEKSDHLPGDQNPENASMHNYASSGPLFEQNGAPNGFEALEYLETGTPEIDYSNCDSPNTAVFGIDRGNNNSGTKTDTDLLQHMKESRFKENKIEVEFYEEEDFGGDPTYINPEDAIVSVQGSGSQAGPCFTMPTEPGWYQVNGMIRGTTEDGETIEIHSKSHYFPICEGCHDEETAHEKLGPPPSQRDDSTPTATPTATPTPTATESSDTDDSGTSETTATPTVTATPDDDEGGSESTDGGGETTDDDDGSAGASGSSGGNATPTPGGGPGFTAITALLALLVLSLAIRRRD